MERRLAAILVADMVGYSRLIAADEAGTIERQKAHRTALIDPKIDQYGGRIVKTTGDGMLVEFPSVVDALQCAVEIQCAMLEREVQVPDAKRIRYRIGINLGDIVIDGEDILGDGVNIAARLEALAEPGGLCISRPVHTQVKGKLDLTFEHLGEKKIKNIPEVVKVYRVVFDEKTAAFVTPVVGEPAKRDRRWRLVVAAAVSMFFLALGGALWWQPWDPKRERASLAGMAHPLPDKPSIAVLPFANLSSDVEQDYLAAAISEEITTTLSEIPQLFVIAQSSTASYRGKPVPPKQVAEEQGVQYVLEGSVQRSGDQLRIKARLVDALKGNLVWSESYDRDFEDILALQDDITDNVATALQVQLTVGEEARIRRRGTTDPEAFLLSHRALWHIRQFNREDVAKAAELIKQAREIAPDALFPLQMEGWIYLANARYGWTGSKQEALDRADAIAKEALAIDPNDPDTNLLIASVHRGRRELDLAVKYAQRAVELNPNHGGAFIVLGQILNYAGRPREALAAVRQGMRLSPDYPVIAPANLCLSHMMIGEYDQAKARCEEVIERGALLLFMHVRLAAISALAGDREEAEKYVAKVLELKPDFSTEKWSSVLFYKNRADLDHEIEGMLKAGLPE